MSFLKALIKEVGDDDTYLASDGTASAEFTGCIDTGSYILNALLSGSFYGGVPNNKITAFAGESTTGKTFFVLGIVRAFLDKNPDAAVVYYDTEAAVTKAMMQSRGIDVNRVIIAEPDTIQKFKTHALKLIEAYEKTPENERPKMMFVLDSLGMLSTSKEMEDSLDGKDVRDMTKSQVIKAAFRVLTLKLAKVKVPMLVTNHVYEVVGSYVPTKEISGGSGLKFAASTIAMLSKKKEKDSDGDIIGNQIKIKMYKSRLSKENKDATVLLTYDKGLDQYFGLLDFAEEHKVFVKSGNRYELPDGRKVFGKEINSNPSAYFTEEIMQRLEECAQKEFSYGSASGTLQGDVQE